MEWKLREVNIEIILYYQYTDMEKIKSIFCGGSLLEKRLVLKAAHRLDSVTDPAHLIALNTHIVPQ